MKKIMFVDLQRKRFGIAKIFETKSHFLHIGFVRIPMHGNYQILSAMNVGIDFFLYLNIIPLKIEKGRFRHSWQIKSDNFAKN